MRQVIIKSQITNQPLRWAFLGGAHEAFLEATESEHRDYSKTTTTFEVLISRVGNLIDLRLSEVGESGRGKMRRDCGSRGGSRVKGGVTIPAMTHRSAYSRT